MVAGQIEPLRHSSFPNQVNVICMNLAQLASTQVSLKKLLQLLEDIFHAFFADGKL